MCAMETFGPLCQPWIDFKLCVVFWICFIILCMEKRDTSEMKIMTFRLHDFFILSQHCLGFPSLPLS